MYVFVLVDQLLEGKIVEGQKVVVGEGNDVFFVGGYYIVFINDLCQWIEYLFVEFVFVCVYFD